MDRKQTNKLACYGAVEALLKATTETSDIAGLPAKLTLLSGKIGEIKSLAQTQTQPLEGRTVNRQRLLDAVVETAVEIATAVATYADEQQLPVLASAVKIGMSDFARARQSHRLWMAGRILDAAQSVLPELAAHGVTEETLTELRERIAAADEGLNEPRITVAEKAAATARLRVLFDETDALLEGQIDRMVFRLRKTSPEFYEAYLVARSVVHQPGVSRGPTGPREASPVVRAANNERRSEAPSGSSAGAAPVPATATNPSVSTADQRAA